MLAALSGRLDRSLARVMSLTSQFHHTKVFNIVRKISGKYSAPPHLFYPMMGGTVADPKTVAGVLAEHFDSVSRRNPAVPMAFHRQHLESVGVNFASSGESYNVPLSLSYAFLCPSAMFIR